MFTVELIGDKALIQRLSSMPDKIRTALIKKATMLAIMLERYIKEDKLSGQVLRVQTGALRSGIFHTVESTSTAVIAEVSAPRDVPYAAIHEFGGVINIPEIVPTKAQALHFVIGGKDIFAKRVRAHTVKMPERSYMRTSLAEKADEIKDGLAEAINEGLK